MLRVYKYRYIIKNEILVTRADWMWHDHTASREKKKGRRTELEKREYSQYRGGGLYKKGVRNPWRNMMIFM